MTNHRRLSVLCAVLCLAFMAPAPVVVRAAPVGCADLVSLALPGGQVTEAGFVRGTFKPPTGTVTAAALRAYAAAPPFCRVAATLRPTPHSAIKIEVWLPESRWNGKLQAVGNGGWAGSMSYTALTAAVSQGYVAAATDSGHATPGASFVLEHPEKLTDYAHRSLHELAVAAKAIAAAYYGKAPVTSIWNGCSTGGNQGLTLASMYPNDFDGIIAGAPPDPRARLMSVRVLINRLVHRSAGSYIPPEKYPAIHQRVLEACDTRDGAKDGVIENPRACRFDPRTMECGAADGPSCLTREQAETASMLYSDVKHPVSGETLYPPLLVPGSELVWGTLAGPQPFPNAADAYRFLAYRSADWDPRTFDAAKDVALMEKAGAPLNTTTHDLRPFFRRGGKLLMYHGWNDRQVPAMSSVTYFERVLKTVGDEWAGKAIQLYMVPGMDHCQGGAGADTFDKVAALESWMASGTAPSSITASHSASGTIDKTRPLCPYPQIARYKGSGDGSGDLGDAANFSCALGR